MFNYSIIKEIFKQEEIGEYSAFGIQIENEVFHDISLNEKEMYDFICRINFYQLSPIHLKEVVEDFLVGM